MTLMLADVAEGDVKTKFSRKGVMMITRTGTRDKITVKGWSADTHNIVYARQSR